MTTDIRPILIVEDDINDIELAIAALRTGNLANPLLIARDGVEALEILNRSSYEA